MSLWVIISKVSLTNASGQGGLLPPVMQVRAGLRLLEQEEAKLDLLRQTLAVGEAQLDQGQGIDGEKFMHELIG